MPATYLDLLTAKVALQLGAIDGDAARAGLRACDQGAAGGLNGFLAQRNLSPDALQRITYCARQCLYLKGEDTYRRLLLQRGFQADAIQPLALQARAEHKRLGAVLVEGQHLRADQDEELKGQCKRALEQESVEVLQGLRQRDYEGIEQPSRLVAQIVSALLQSPAEGTQILPQDVASGRQAPPTSYTQSGSGDVVASGARRAAAVAAPPPPTLGASAESTAAFSPGPADHLPLELQGTGLDEKYVVARKLGEGGMGAVYLAYDRDDEARERPMALKVVRTSVVGSERSREAAERFKREILATSFCAHENIIEIYDANETRDGSYYMAMEFLEGAQLDELVQREGPFSVARFVPLLEDALKAMVAMHEANIVHRDIKPQNFRIYRDKTGRERLKMMDFGIARVLDAEDSGAGEQFFRTMAGKITGSPAYIAPESITEPETVDQRADLYSLGITIFRVLAGRLPFVAKDPNEYLPLHLYEPPPPLRGAVPDAPPALEQLYFKLLEKVRDRRIGTAREALEFLEREVKPTIKSGPVAREAGKSSLESTAGDDRAPQVPLSESSESSSSSGRNRRASEKVIPRPVLEAAPASSGKGLRVLLILAGAAVLVLGASLVAAWRLGLLPHG